MKLKLLLILCFTTGCTSKLHIEIYNNSGYSIVIYDNDKIVIESGKHKVVKMSSSVRHIKLDKDGKTYTYTFNAGDLSGRYFVPGIIHTIKLQVEPNLIIYVLNVDSSPVIKSIEGTVQPPGFPLIPKIKGVRLD